MSTTMRSHAACDHDATKAARAKCRRATSQPKADNVHDLEAAKLKKLAKRSTLELKVLMAKTDDVAMKFACARIIERRLASR